MPDMTPQEEAIFPKLTDQHKALIPTLGRFEKDSLAKYVNPGNIDAIQGWIGDDQAIEDMLFWDRGGKYDDPAWQALKPLNGTTAQLMAKATEHYAALRKQAVEVQRRSDITLYSQFNPGLLFTGIAGAVRCDASGQAKQDGEFYQGVEFRLIGSVEDEINAATIFPDANGGYEISLGGRQDGEPQGIWTYTGDSHSLLQLAQVGVKVLPKQSFDTRVVNPQGQVVALDPKAIRQAAMGDAEPIDFGKELKLFASKSVESLDEAISAVTLLATKLYERFGLEIEAYKIGRKYGNFSIMREDNFDEYLPAKANGHKALILLTATLVCRRCRREMKDFRDAARDYPNARFALVNLSSPQFKFYERVFGDMGGGDPDEFRKNAAGVTPFIIVYKADEDGVLKFDEYIATDKHQATPELHKDMQKLAPLFG
jgi:hypothetical protein